MNFLYAWRFPHECRQLITMEKHADAELTDGVGKPSTNSSSATTGHYDFRKSYFNAFNKDRAITAST